MEEAICEFSPAAIARNPRNYVLDPLQDRLRAAGLPSALADMAAYAKQSKSEERKDALTELMRGSGAPPRHSTVTDSSHKN